MGRCWRAGVDAEVDCRDVNEDHGDAGFEDESCVTPVVLEAVLAHAQKAAAADDIVRDLHEDCGDEVS